MIIRNIRYWTVMMVECQKFHPRKFNIADDCHLDKKIKLWIGIADRILPHSKLVISDCCIAFPVAFEIWALSVLGHCGHFYVSPVMLFVLCSSIFAPNHAINRCV